MDTNNSKTGPSSFEDPLLPYLQQAIDDPDQILPGSLSHVFFDVMTKGYSIIPSVLSLSECEESLDLMWDFIEDVSGGIICRNDGDPKNWYPRSRLIPIDTSVSENSINDLMSENQGDDTEDPWPHTGYGSFPDMFQSLGAGFLLGHVRCLLAERLFEPLFGGLQELHCSKEGFTLARPCIVPRPPIQTSSYDSMQRWKWLRNKEEDINNMSNTLPRKSQGEHYDQSHSVKGLHTLQASVAFTNQSEEEQDGHFLCWPYSHSVHQLLTGGGKYRGQFSWIPMTDEELHQLESMNVKSCMHEYLDKHGLNLELLSSMTFCPTHVYVEAGDVIVWRSDLLHAAVTPGPNSTRFRAVGYFSMQPASWTPNFPQVHPDKIQAYKHGMTGDHRAFVESWHVHKRWNKRKKIGGIEKKQRPYFRFSPPLISIRLAQLYGLVPYDNTDVDNVIKRATIRGVRFIPSIIHQEDLNSNPNKGSKHQIHSSRLKLACDASIETLVIEDGSLLQGQEKYLGGMCSPCGNYVYGCPGHAHRVLRVNTRTNVMDFIGPSFPGKYKWLRGVEIPASVMANEDEYPLGCCIALPSNALSVLKINPQTQEVTTFGNLTEDSGWLYHGGNLLSDGFVYAIPANASHVLKIDPRGNEVEKFGPKFDGKQKWYGGIVGCDGCLYGIPQNHNGVLKINPWEQSCSILTSDNVPDGDWKWHGGLAIQDGRFIMGFPNNAASVLLIDVLGQKVLTVTSPVLRSGRHRIPQDDRYKYLGGAVTKDGRFTYLFPCDAERVLRMDNYTFELTLIGPYLLEGENKFQNGFLGKDGCLYGINQRSCGILRITPSSVLREQLKGTDALQRLSDKDLENDHVELIYGGDDMVLVKDKFEGGVIDLEGNIYCIPMQAKALIKIVPGRC